MPMNPAFHFTLGFAFLFAITTPALASNHVVDWKGDPLKVGVLYDMWSVGKDKGPIAVGLSTLPFHIHFVIAKPYREIDPFLPDPVTFHSTNASEKWVRVGQDYTIHFGSSNCPSNFWVVGGRLSPYPNFITSSQLSCNHYGSLFQLKPVDEDQHLYKLTTHIETGHIPYPFPFVTVDVKSEWRDGEDRLCVNQGSKVNLRFVEHKPVIHQVV